MYLVTDINKKWCSLSKGDKVEIIAHHPPAVIIECKGHKLAVSEGELVEVRPVVDIKKGPVKR